MGALSHRPHQLPSPTMETATRRPVLGRGRPRGKRRQRWGASCPSVRHPQPGNRASRMRLRGSGRGRAGGGWGSQDSRGPGEEDARCRGMCSGSLSSGRRREKDTPSGCRAAGMPSASTALLRSEGRVDALPMCLCPCPSVRGPACVPNPVSHPRRVPTLGLPGAPPPTASHSAPAVPPAHPAVPLGSRLSRVLQTAVLTPEAESDI